MHFVPETWRTILPKKELSKCLVKNLEIVYKIGVKVMDDITTWVDKNFVEVPFKQTFVLN
jgi:hypothetical protein